MKFFSEEIIGMYAGILVYKESDCLFMEKIYHSLYMMYTCVGK